MIVSCAFCDGTGIQPHSLKMACLSCHGKGKVEFECAAIVCSACKGSGRVSSFSELSCIQCRGVGMIEEVRKDEDKDILRRNVKRLYEAGRWIKNQLTTKEIQFKAIIYKIKSQLINGIRRIIK